MKITYIADDGTKFGSRRDAEAHEAGLTFDRLASLSEEQIAAIPLTGDAWQKANDGVKFMAKLFERFGLAINAARRDAGDVRRPGEKRRSPRRAKRAKRTRPARPTARSSATRTRLPPKIAVSSATEPQPTSPLTIIRLEPALAGFFLLSILNHSFARLTYRAETPTLQKSRCLPPKLRAAIEGKT